jgi:hypothetical protein
LRLYPPGIVNGRDPIDSKEHLLISFNNWKRTCKKYVKLGRSVRTLLAG